MRALSLLSTTILLMSCAPILQSTHAQSGSVGRHERKSADGAAAMAAHAGLQAQVNAWNRRDLEAALSTYWDAPQMTWVSRSGVERGFASFAGGMRRDFADPAAMGVYSAEVLDVRGLGPETGSVVFKWEISRAGKRVMGGTSTQIWRRLNGTWKAVLEHAS
jgi:hypothetical protein